MACFIAPVAEAVVVTVTKKIIEKKEREKYQVDSSQKQNQESAMETENNRFGTKLGWLAKLLWGGSFLLFIEHIWHGEIVPWPPFLTAMGSMEDTQAMLGEIATTGVSMAVVITVVWLAMIAVIKIKETGKVKEKKLS